MTPTSTIITTWAPDAMNYIWDSMTGFLFSSGANGQLFLLEILMTVGVVTIAIGAVTMIFPNTFKFRKK